jgi:hypothetical protein
MRKSISLLLFFTGLILLFTSIILYIEPPGRIAYWVEWNFFGLSKDNWDDLHINSGVFFLIFGFLHIYYNWKSITGYLSQKKSLNFFTSPVFISIFITFVITTGSILNLPPFSFISGLSAAIKESYPKKYGNPPYGHAELSSLERTAKETGISVDECLKILAQKGIHVTDPKNSIKDIAKKAHLNPNQVYNFLIEKKSIDDPFSALPANPPEGAGRLSLKEFASQNKLPLDEVLSRLKNKNINANPEQNFKNIANENKIDPRQVYQIIKGD